MAKKVLIIDDEISSLITLKDSLEYEGYEVITAVDGESGIKKTEEEKPDLIVLDIMLPGIDGYEVCRKIKAKYDIPIIMNTGKVDVSDAVKAREAGADKFILKMIDWKLLVDNIKKMVP